MEEFVDAPINDRSILAGSAAWAPNPNKPPFYANLPTIDGVIQPDIVSKIHANQALAIIDQYIGNLKQMTAIAFDVGDKDTAIAAASRKLSAVLDDYGIDYSFEVYDGDHFNRLRERLEMHAIPFFSENLAFED